MLIHILHMCWGGQTHRQGCCACFLPTASGKEQALAPCNGPPAQRAAGQPPAAASAELGVATWDEGALHRALEAHCTHRRVTRFG
jgi:hypothetical protein